MTQQPMTTAQEVIEGPWKLPDGWEWHPVSYLVTDTSRQNPATLSSEYFRYVDIGSVNNDLGQISVDSVQTLSTKDAPSRARKVIKEDDVIFATTRPYLRNIAIIPQELDNQICSTGFCVLRTRPGIAIPKFVYYACRSRFFIDQLIPRQRGANYPAVTDTDVYQSMIPVPFIASPDLSLRIQRAIVARIESLLTELREIRELHDAIDRDVAQVMDSVFQEVFTTEATASWNEDSLGNVVEINAKLVDPTLPTHKHLPHIHGGVMTEATCRLLPYNSAAEDDVKSGKYLFSPNSVLYSKIRPKLRKVVLVHFQGLCSADVYPLEPKDPQVLAREFLQWVLVSQQFTDYAVQLSGRARIPKINQDQLFAYRIRYPSIDQQHQIAHYILSIRQEIEAMQDIQSEDTMLLEQVEQAILEQAFRGEL